MFLSKYKCASESVRRALDPFSDIRSTQQYPFYHHTPLAPLKRHFESVGWDWNDYFVFTTVRHPLAMLASLYNYGRPDRDRSYWWERHRAAVLQAHKTGVTIGDLEVEAPRPVSFRDWILTHDLSRFTLDPFVCDTDGAVSAATVLRVENLAEEFTAIVQQLGLNDVTIPRLNIAPEARPHEFDDEMRQKVRELFATDMRFGGYDV